MSISPAREAAAVLLMRWEKRKAYADILYRKEIGSFSLEPRDKALAAFLFYGTIENKLYIDWLLTGLSKIPLKKIHPMVLSILRVAGFQILFAEKIPVHAACNEAVSLVGHCNPRAKGFANALLRRFAEYRENRPQPQDCTPEEKLSILYSHPLSLVHRYRTFLSVENTEALLQWNNSSLSTEIRINTLRHSEKEVKEILASEGIEIEYDATMSTLGKVLSPLTPEDSPAFHRGEYTVQSKSSYLSVLAGAPQPGERVADVCAAPGGKSFACAALMKNRGSIFSYDYLENKITLLQKEADRLGINCLQASVRDATKETPELGKYFDLVLCDVPCSGLGVIGKKPDIRYSYEREDERADLPERQFAILSASANLVKPGGRLVYSTCTLNPEENQMIVNRFLKKRGDFCRENSLLPEPYVMQDGELELFPPRDKTDGFYFCRLRRNDE